MTSYRSWRIRQCICKHLLCWKTYYWICSEKY